LFKSYQYRRKTAEQELQRKTLEIEKNLLKSQMNPHFIFNAMNSIQSFIAVNDTLSAERYLSKFARLIRMILENSTKQTVPLSDEMQALQFYLDLERVRFNYKFDYDLELDNNIEEELICIPPMLIQPFVENAILHGIMHKKDKGNIKINIIDDEEKQTLICVIADDGIGREAAQKLKEQFKSEGRKHKSIGMQLTRDRLDAINKETGQELNCVIEDIMDDNNNACGTKVTIKIPYSELKN
jgi:LytS/YehU family sensor histidine kinase